MPAKKVSAKTVPAKSVSAKSVSAKTVSAKTVPAKTVSLKKDAAAKKPSASKARRVKAPKAAAQQPSSQSEYYVAPSNATPILSDRKPEHAGKVRRYADFEQARSAAIDALVDSIERAEADLARLKSAPSYDAWRAQS